MKKSSFRRLTMAMLVTVGFSSTMPVLSADKPVAYVSNQNGSVTIIDLNSMAEIGSLDIAAKGPRGIGITPDGKLLVTANKDGRNISIVDTAGVNPPQLVAIGQNPEFVRILGNRAYITYEPSSSGAAPKPGAKDDDDDKTPGHIAIVDLKLGKIIGDIVGKPETEGVEFSKDGKLMLVTNESDNSITVYDLVANKLQKIIPLAKYGSRPRGIKTSPDGKTYVTTLEFSNKLLVLNDKFEVIKEVATGLFPYGVSFDHSGKRLFVAANHDKSLQVFDAKTFEKIKDIPTGDRCWHFSFTPDDQQILLACGKSNEIIIVDANKLEVTQRIPAKDLPWGIVTYPKSMGSLDTL